MKTKKTVILCTIIGILVLSSLVLASRSGAAETVLVSPNSPSSSQSTAPRNFIDSLQMAPLPLANLSNAVISAVQSGSTNASNIAVDSNPNPIGTTVMIDIRIDNATPFWGWTLPTVAWNASVLQLTAVTEGPYLSDNTGSDSTNFIGNSPLLWDNTNGLIDGGLSEAIQGADTSTDASGVLATLTFNVTRYGISPITIAGCNLRATYNDTVGVNVTCNSASVTIAQALISMYGSGTQNSTIIWSAHQSPINQTFQVEVYINGAANVTDAWGWNIGVTWDPSVLNLTAITEGSYLDQSGSTLFLPGIIDNIDGLVLGGISDAYVSYISASASSGVLVTLTFKIISYEYGLGNSNIGLTAGTPATLLNSAYPHQAVTPVVLDNASYSWYRIPGDINADGTVDIYDAILLASAFNSTPGSKNWNPQADLNGDGVVDIYDAIILAAHFGQSLP